MSLGLFAGLFAASWLGGECIKEKSDRDSLNYRRKNEAKNKGEKVYWDYSGKTRSVETDEIVSPVTIGCDSCERVVLRGVETRRIYVDDNSYTDSAKLIREFNKQIEDAKQDMINNKQKAIENEEYYYSYKVYKDRFHLADTFYKRTSDDKDLELKDYTMRGCYRVLIILKENGFAYRTISQCPNDIDKDAVAHYNSYKLINSELAIIDENKLEYAKKENIPFLDETINWAHLNLAPYKWAKEGKEKAKTFWD